MRQPPITCVVPARLGSTRFPRKLLQPLFGKPVVVHTLERAAEAQCFSDVVCFTDSLEIGEAVAEHGFRFVLTGEAANGTERIARNLDSIDTNLIVNLQGDEPAFPLEGLRLLAAALCENPQWVHTLVHADEPSDADLKNENRVKALLTHDHFVMDFIRIMAPVVVGTRHAVSLQLGAYGYPKNFLRRYAATPVSKRETGMSHELLRDLNLAPLRAHASPAGASVDAPEDLAIAREGLQNMRARTLEGVS